MIPPTATASRPALSTDPSAYGDFDHERLAIIQGPRSEATAIVAVHSTVLGPALGGARMWHYPDPHDGVVDALRLAGAMTLKASIAGLDLGGGKGVIALGAEPATPEGRTAALLDFADLVDSLGGSYITAEDVGTGPADMATIATRTDHVVGLPGASGDPSPVTARGVEAAIHAAAAHRFGERSLRGLRVAIIGLGHVGSSLAELLAAEGCELAVTDIDRSRAEPAVERGARWIDPAAAIEVDCDVLAPCALGQVVTHANIERLRCRIICGAANNLLADEGLAEALVERGITYAPDFVANAGGLISVYGELRGSAEDAGALADGIEDRMAAIFAEAAAAGSTPLEAARALAWQRIQAAAASRSRPATIS